jgi:hypothetical protein
LNLQLIIKGATNKELAENLVLATTTAKEDISKILHLIPQERMGNIDYRIHSVSGALQEILTKVFKFRLPLVSLANQARRGGSSL